MWPGIPSCHAAERIGMVGKNAPADFHPLEWRAPFRMDPYEYAFRTCSWCGAMHPEDLVAALRNGSPVEWAKPGYKIYVDVPNPISGQEVKCGSRSGPVDPDDMSKGRYDEPIYGAAPPTVMGKWYTTHLHDEYSGDALDTLLQAIAEQSGVQLYRGADGRWMWKGC